MECWFATFGNVGCRTTCENKHVCSGTPPSELLRMLEEAYGKATKKRTQVSKWHEHFREGYDSVTDDLYCGQPSVSTNN
jgi:hypothetical protein